MANPFNGPRAKIRRARKHIAELDEQEAAFFDGEVWETVFEDQGNGQSIMFAKLNRNVDEDIPTIVADIVGGLRSSLDLAVCAAGKRAGATDLRHTYFHFASTADEWEKSFKGRMKAAPAAIIEANRALKPWVGGSDLLYALSRISVADKHQLLTPVGVNSGKTTFGGVHAIEGGIGIIGGAWDREKSRLPLLVLDNSGHYRFEGITLTTYFAFGDVDVVPGQPILPIVRKLADMCDEIVDTFEAASS